MQCFHYAYKWKCWFGAVEKLIKLCRKIACAIEKESEKIRIHILGIVLVRGKMGEWETFESFKKKKK